MSSVADTYKVLVAGDEETGYSLCLRLTDKDIVDPRVQAVESLSRDWPKDEWTKFYTVSLEGKISTVKLDLELHGPWVWELYNVMDPKDYFRRFDGAIICGNPKRPDSLGVISSLIESIESNIAAKIPIIIIVDSTNELKEKEIAPFEEVANSLNIAFVAVNIQNGKNIEDVFKNLARVIHQNERR
ncbi:MAG: hypothetical protein ACFFEJ_18050 [Candidatus Thorarchaeota archaeon]